MSIYLSTFEQSFSLFSQTNDFYPACLSGLNLLFDQSPVQYLELYFLALANRDSEPFITCGNATRKLFNIPQEGQKNAIVSFMIRIWHFCSSLPIRQSEIFVILGRSNILHMLFYKIIRYFTVFNFKKRYLDLTWSQYFIVKQRFKANRIVRSWDYKRKLE